ncbi:MAG: GntR family transcriptional regulator [Treponema sp.]|jgi:DNA-binding FadR family transcriptional regulator|nr:GntR family transcriptional regulator [Treponema sp.]
MKENSKIKLFPLKGEQIQQKTVVAQTMEKVRELITSGFYKPGDKIPTEQELAEHFGIGRSSIREAIKIFQHMGILESRVPKGTFLCDRSQISTEAISWALLLGSDDMWEILELRQIIEEAAFLSLITKYIRKPSSCRPVIEALEAEVENMKNALGENSIEKLSLADYNFHAIIIREGNNNLFLAIFKILNAFLEAEICKTYFAIKNLRDVSKDHQEIIDAIKTGVQKKAVQRHSAHFLRIRGLLAPGALPKT